MTSFLLSFGGTSSSKTIKEPKDALLDFIQGPDGAQWQDMRDGWNIESDDVCSWPGIECNDNNEVIKINLENSGLIASIPKSIGTSLLSLTHLNLSSDHIFGEIPNELLTLPNLIYVNLERNNLRGNVPIFTGSTQIEVINISHNSFSGKFPNNFGEQMIHATNLKVLDMKYNRISGSLPKSLEQLSSTLVEFDISSNRLYGIIPDIFNKLNQLEGIFLSNNRLSGPIPPSLTHGEMMLSQIFIQGNNLSGTLPVSLADLQHLKNLFIDGNKFTGTVPKELCNKNLNSVFFEGTPIEIRGGDSDYDDDYKPISDDETYDEDVLSMELQEEEDENEHNNYYYSNDNNEEENNELHTSSGINNNNDKEDILIINGTSVPVQYANDDETNDNNNERRRNQRRYLQQQQQQQQQEEMSNTLEGQTITAKDISSTDQEQQQQQGEEEQCTDDIGCIRNGCNSIACPAGYVSTSIGKDGVYPCRKCHHDYINPYIGSNCCYVVDQYNILMTLYNDTNGSNWYGDHTLWGSSSDSSNICTWSGIACNINNDIISIVLPNSNLHGTITPNIGFLRHLEVLDLSDNFLTGNIPNELSYAPLDVLDISGNALEGIVPSVLCEKHGINNNGYDGIFSCNKIACPIGTYSTTGRGGGKDGTCIPCDKSGATFLSMKACASSFMPQKTNVNTSNNDNSTVSKVRAIGSVVMLSVMGNILMCCAFYIIKRRRKMLKEIHNINEQEGYIVDDDFDSDLEGDDNEEIMVAISRNNNERQGQPKRQNSSSSSSRRSKGNEIGWLSTEIDVPRNFDREMQVTSDLHFVSSNTTTPFEKSKGNKSQEKQEVWLDVPKIN